MGNSSVLEKADWRAIHGGLLVFSFVIFVAVSGDPGRWPLYLLVPLLFYAVLVASVPPLRRTCTWLLLGQFNRYTISLTVGIVLVSSAALVFHQVSVAPDLEYLHARLPLKAFGSAFLAGLVFCPVNALLEEITFRGILFDAIAAYWKQKAAIVVTALAFSLGHIEGYPPGLLGGLLAGVYGLLLGVLRQQSRGLALPVLAHVFADATIITLVAVSDPSWG